jgi:alkaline phosphatase D
VWLHYGKDRSWAHFSSIGPFAVDAAADHTVQIEMDTLEAATTYFYYATAGRKQPAYAGSFITAPAPDDLANVTFCFSGDTQESYQPFTIMNAVRAQQPNFFLHLGDTIYADRDWQARTLDEFWEKYRANRIDAATQLCLSQMSTYVVWDDHDVLENHVADDPLASIGRKAFIDYWPIRRDKLERQRIYRSFRWGKAMELFLLDTRQYRDPSSRTKLGKTQKKWLLDKVSRSTALFKFIATSVPMFGGGRDRWDGYPEERKEILNFITQRKLTGVVFLSADLHYAAITRLPDAGGLKDITAGPLAAPLNRIANGADPAFEYFSADRFNFVKITINPTVEPTNAQVEFIDKDNRRMHRTQIAAL